MAGDKPKEPVSGKALDAELDDWASAIDEWDAKLDSVIPTDPAAIALATPAAPTPEPPVAPTPPVAAPLPPEMMAPTPAPVLGATPPGGTPAIDEAPELASGPVQAITATATPVPSGADEPPPLAPSPHAGASAGADPLMQLFDGDMELPEDAGQALGSLVSTGRERPDDDDDAPPQPAEIDAAVEAQVEESFADAFGAEESTRVASRDEFEALLDSLGDRTPPPAEPPGARAATPTPAAAKAPPAVATPGAAAHDDDDDLEIETSYAAAEARPAPAASAPPPDDDFYDDISIEAGREDSLPKPAPAAPAFVDDSTDILVDPPLVRDRSSDPDVTPLPVAQEDLFGAPTTGSGARPRRTPLAPRRIDVQVSLSPPMPPREGAPSAPPPDASYWQGQLSLYDTERILVSDAARAAELACLAAHTCERVGDWAGAAERYQAALEQDAGSQVALRGLRRALMRTGQLDRALTLVEREAERGSDGERQALFSVAAELHLAARDVDLANQAYAQANKTAGADAPESQPSLWARVDAAVDAGAEPGAEALAALQTQIREPALRAALLVEEARLLEACGRLRDAVAGYREALALDGHALGAVFGLMRVAVRTPSDADDVEPFTRFAEVLPRGGLRAAVERRVAVLQERGGDAAAARPLLANNLDDNPLVISALYALELKAGRLDDAAAILARLVTAEADAGQRASSLIELGRLEEQRGNTGNAVAAYQRAVTEYPEDPRAARALERNAATSGDKAQALERHLAKAARVAALAPLEWTRAARLLEELGRTDEADQRLQAAIAAQPGFPPAVSLAVELALGRGKLGEAAQILDGAAGVADDAQQAAWMRERAARFYRRAGMNDAARAALAPIMAQGAPPQMRWLSERVNAAAPEGATRNEALEQDLRAEAENAELGDRARAVELWHWLGLLAGASDEAVESQRRALNVDAGHGTAFLALFSHLATNGPLDEIPQLVENAASGHHGRPQSAFDAQRQALSYVMDRADFAAAKTVLDRAGREHPSHAAECLETVERFARRVGDDATIAAACDREAAAEGTTPEAKEALAVLAAERYERLGQFDRAAERLRHALEARQTPPLREALERVLESGRSYAALAELALADLRDATTSSAKVRAYEKLTYIDGELRGDRESALHGYQSILESDHSHHLAIRALERVYLRDNRIADLVALDEMLGLVSENPDFAAVVHLDRARLRQRLAKTTPGSISADELAAAVDNDHRLALFKSSHFRPALRHLMARARGAGDATQVADLAARIGDTLGDDKLAAAVWFTRAGDALLATGADAVPAAQTRYRQALERRPGHVAALRALLDLGLERSEWGVAISAAEALAPQIRLPVARARMFLVAGGLAEERLVEPRRAWTSLAAALELEPASLEVFDRSRRVLTTLADYAALADLFRRRLEVETDGQKIIALRLAIAKIARDHLQDRERARNELKAALGQDPSCLPALRLLGDMAFEEERWTEAADAFIKRARLEKDARELRTLFYRLGIIYADKEPDAKRAIACFSRVVKADPTDVVALEYLSNLFMKEWDYKGALEATRRLTDLEKDRGRRIGHFHRIAKIHEEGFKDARHALEAFQHALEIDPMDLGSIGELARFFDRHSDVKSMRVHLDRSATRVRQLLDRDAFDPKALHALFRVFTWRRAPDRAYMAASILEHLGVADLEEKTFLQKAHTRDPYPGSALADAAVDEGLFDGRIPPGFRHLFRLIDELLAKTYRNDVKRLPLARNEKLPPRGHALRDIANRVAADLGVREFDLYVTAQHPTALFVELTEPLTLVVGSQLVEGAHENQARFFFGRLLKMVQCRMSVAMRLPPEELGTIVGGIVRQFIPDFVPVGFDAGAVAAQSARLAKVIPKKLHAELAPFAMECASPSLNLMTLGPALVETANRAGLLTCGVPQAALQALGRVGDIEQARALVRFALGEEMAELRRLAGTSLG